MPLLLVGLLVLAVLALGKPLRTWLSGEDSYDRAALKEWLDEARTFRETLPEMIESYLARAERYERLQAQAEAGGPSSADEAARLLLLQYQAEKSATAKRTEIYEHLQALGDPPAKMYGNQLPLFPIIYCLQVQFDEQPGGKPLPPITWDSQLPCHYGQYHELTHRLPHARARVYMRYQLHTFNKRQRDEQTRNATLLQLGLLAMAVTVLGLGWLVRVQWQARERERQQAQVQYQVDQAERLLLREENRREETERKLLEQRLATQAAERQALELKSQLFASIGIMAGSYAHNIKNLLVRPNDLLRRCLEAEGVSADLAQMLHEVRHTLGTVTERLQQILKTVRRDPTKSEPAVLDLNAVLGDLARTWRDLARDKWKLELTAGVREEGDRPARSASEDPSSPLPPDPSLRTPALWIAGDLSHLQQAVENLLFNARDATFEMRNHLRDEARRAEGLDGSGRRQALIAAASWKGRVVLRGWREGNQVVLEVSDNGIGMTEEVRRRCTETHFSTKRDNALYEGHNTGMGLGLSFVVAILEHHRATLEIESEPLHGTTFRARFPAADPGG
jgi:signal transduction histidine kinase